MATDQPIKPGPGPLAATSIPESRDAQPAMGSAELASSLPAGDEPPAHLPIGNRIGRYVVLELLGSGSMGLVLAAYDPELDRKAALKLLHPTRKPTRARARLRREAQALARLNHGNVVTIYDVGIHEGRLFVAMEFVAGRTLFEWMNEHEGQPRAWREVLSVFAPAGRGLAAAHGAGLIHRDFKPENVMLGDDGRVRVMDFGLARLDETRSSTGDSAPGSEGDTGSDSGPENTRLTRAGALLGTPAYMAPEQLVGDPADARSDQFAYCVALYEALYGYRPFAGGSVDDLRLTVVRGEIRPPLRNAKVPAWIESIVLRGLSVDPDARYPSMAALLTALGDDPSQRVRRVIGVGAITLGLITAAWAGGAVFEREPPRCAAMERELEGVWDARRRTELGQAIRATELGYAAPTWERVEQLLDRYTDSWVAARVETCEATEAGVQSEALLDRRMACLDERLTHVRAAVSELAQADAATVEHAIEAVSALPSLDRCADVDALLAELPGPDDREVAAEVEVLELDLVRAKTKHALGEYEGAERIASNVVARAVVVGYEPTLARARLVHARTQAKLGEHDEARQAYERAYDVAVAWRMTDEAATAALRLVPLIGVELADHHDAQLWAVHADPWSRAVGTESVRAAYFDGAGLLARSMGEYDQAEALLEQALTLREQSVGPEHLSFAKTLVRLASVAAARADFEAAQVQYERALEIEGRALGAGHPALSGLLNNLGSVAAKQGDFERAQTYFEQSLELAEAAFGPEHPSLALALGNLGLIANSLGDRETARARLERARSIYEASVGPEHPSLARVLGNLGYVEKGAGNYARATAYYERALAITEARLGPENPALFNIVGNLGNIAEAEGDVAEARSFYERALGLAEAGFGPEHKNVALILASLADVAEAEGELERAEELRARALAIDPGALDDTNP